MLPVRFSSNLGRKSRGGPELLLTHARRPQVCAATAVKTRLPRGCLVIAALLDTDWTHTVCKIPSDRSSNEVHMYVAVCYIWPYA